MPDVSDYHRVNAALLPVDSAPTTVLGRKTGLEAGSSGSTDVLFMKTDLRLKRSVENSPIGRATDRDRARKAPQVFTPRWRARPGAFWISSFSRSSMRC
jgi:hypothetical protein